MNDVSVFKTKGFGLPLALIAASVGVAFLSFLPQVVQADVAVLRMLALREGVSSDVSISLTQALTWIGDGSQRAIWLTLAALFLLWKGQRTAAIILVVMPVLAGVTSDLLKEVFGRARPDLFPKLDHATSLSMPSGHATGAMAIFLTIALLVPVGSTRVRVTMALLLALAIGLSRPMLGVHWPTDIVAGWLLGLGYALLALALVKRFGPIPQ
jgi:undecaprenyl-diphosphatase